MRPHRPTARPLCPKRLSLLVAQAMLLWLAAPVADAGVITLTGNYWSDPWDATPFPSGDISAADVHLSIGTGGWGEFSLTGGAHASLRGLAYAVSNNGVSGNASGVIDGAGTLLELHNTNGGRLTVGGFGTGSLTLSGGAVINAAFDPVACSQQDIWCGVNIGGSAGSNGTFTLTGQGTAATFLHGIDIAHGYRDPWGSITGGTSVGQVNILDGAHLTSEHSYSADSVLTGWQTPGTESAYAGVLISGPGSTWTLTNLGTNSVPVLSLGEGVRSSANLDINNGGSLVLSAAGKDAYTALRLGNNGSQVTATVSTGGRIVLDSENSNLQVGNGGYGKLSVIDGGTLSGGSYIEIGSGGGTGVLIVDGSASSATFRDGSQINIGASGTGTLRLTGGASITGGSLNIGGHTGHGDALLSGAGTRFTANKTDWHRLSIDNGSLTVADGAVFDATQNAAACVNTWCGSFLANNAGNQASLIVTGAGSRVSLLDTLNAGGGYATSPPSTDYTLGIPGASTSSTIKVLDGGKLSSQYAALGNGSNGSAANGQEQNYINVLLQGAGSSWTVSGNALNGNAAWLNTGASSSGYGDSVSLRILDGAELVLGSAGVQTAYLTLGYQGGVSDTVVSGAGARINFVSPDSYLTIGTNGAYSKLSVTQGGQINNANSVSVGTNGGNGTLIFDGIGSGLTGGQQDSSGIFVGRNGGSGRVQISNGAVVDFRGDHYGYLQVGFDWQGRGGNGALSISGPGSQLLLGSADSSAIGTIANPSAYIGYGASGQLTISNGGLLSLLGNVDESNATELMIGVGLPNSTYSPVGNGIATVTGAGSRLQISGKNASIEVGLGALGNGQLNVLNGGQVETALLLVGAAGGAGQLVADAGKLTLSGTWYDEPATLALGNNLGSVGSAQLRNGSVLSIGSPGASGALLQVGIGGTGVLNASGNSRITLTAAAGKAVAEINGASSVTLNSSTLEVVGGNVYVGGHSGDNASLNLANQSAVTASYVGVGSRHGVDGGNASLIVNGSTVTANTLEVGANGYVGGNGTLIANIINRGVFNPGNSPGTLLINGDFINQAGGKLVLEVEADGAGGYNIDHLLFAQGTKLDFSGLQVSFHFLGNTDPTAFQASGQFDIDNFLDYQGSGDLDHNLFASTSFSAQSDHYTFSSFSFTADGGATLAITAVPEPGSWAMLLGGLGLMGWRLRRKAA